MKPRLVFFKIEKAALNGTIWAQKDGLIQLTLADPFETIATVLDVAGARKLAGLLLDAAGEVSGVGSEVGP